MADGLIELPFPGQRISQIIVGLAEIGIELDCGSIGLELNVKTKNFGTVSLEENIVVTKDGCEFLVPPQERFILIK